MLLGTGGRSVMLILSGSGGQPVMEWNLGPDKQGQMRAPLPTSTTGQAAALRLEPSTGELFAVIGQGRDARVLGDGLHLGPYWKTVLGERPRVAVGCLEGTCRFQSLVLEGQALKSTLTPPPSPPLEVDVQNLPEPKKPTTPIAKPVVKPTPKPTPVVAVTKAPVKAPPPPPVKKPAVQTPPKKGGR
jgi:hypothetical protein